MLNMKNPDDKIKMFNYYRTSDMLNLIEHFPRLSPIKDMIIIEDLSDYEKNKEIINQYSQNRVDTLKGRRYIDGIENNGKKTTFYETLIKVKEQDPYGVIVLFNLDSECSERYQRYAGISVGIDLYSQIIIDAVSKGFDGREVSKSICVHERYIIPWSDLRKLSIDNFKTYRTFLIDESEYQITRNNRIDFLTSVGYSKELIEENIPIKYQEIPNKIWKSVISNLIKKIEKEAEILENYGFSNFAISGHTEGNEFKPWQIFDKSRYSEYNKK